MGGEKFLKKNLSIKTLPIYFNFYKIFSNKNLYIYINQFYGYKFKLFFKIFYFFSKIYLTMFLNKVSLQYNLSNNSFLNIKKNLKFYSRDNYFLVQSNLKISNFSFMSYNQVVTTLSTGREYLSLGVYQNNVLILYLNVLYFEKLRTTLKVLKLISIFF